MVPKPKRPPRLSGGGLDGPKTKESPSPQRRGPRWSQSQGGPHRLSGGGLDGPKANEAPTALAAGASMVPKPRRPPPP